MTAPTLPLIIGKPLNTVSVADVIVGPEGIVSKRVLSPYRSGPSKFWLKTKNVVESELILLGTDYDNEGKPIAYLGKEQGGELKFAGTAFLTLSGDARERLHHIARLPSADAATVVPKVRQPEWVTPQIVVRVQHLAGGDTLRHAIVKGQVDRVMTRTQ